MKKKRILSLLIGSTMILSLLAGCGNTATTALTGSASPTPEPQEETTLPVTQDNGESNILIAYFTAHENTKVDAISSASVVTINGEDVGIVASIANVIARETGGELFSILTSVEYSPNIGEVIDFATIEKAENHRPELISQIESLDDYDIVFIGFPNWRYDMPMVMYSFFDEYDFSGKTIIPFNAHNGSRFSNTISTIAELEPNAMVITDGFTVSHNSAANAANDIVA